MKYGIIITVTALLFITFAWYIFRYLPMTADLPDGLNQHGVKYHACCEGIFCCGMGKDCCDPEEEKLGEACKNSDCNKIK